METVGKFKAPVNGKAWMQKDFPGHLCPSDRISQDMNKYLMVQERLAKQGLRTRSGYLWPEEQYATHPSGSAYRP